MAELASGLHRTFASPLTSVGDRVVDAVPQWLKAFAIETFGTNDKAVLLGTLAVLIAVFASLLGVLSQRHLALATVGVALFGLAGGLAAAAGTGGIPATVPSLVGAVAGIAAMRFLASPSSPKPPPPSCAAVFAPISMNCASPACARARITLSTHAFSTKLPINSRRPSGCCWRNGRWMKPPSLPSTVSASEC